MTEYPRLFAPLALGPRTVRNRVVFTAHLTNFAVDGLPTERHAAYYEARARGGAGLIITEEQCTHPSDRPYEKLVRGYLPRWSSAIDRSPTPCTGTAVWCWRS